MSDVPKYLLLVFGIFIVICSAMPGYAEERNASPILWQVSSLALVESGDYHGVVTVDELKKHGSFGIGGFKDLDGELSELNGTVWQIRYDGTVAEPSGDTGVCLADIIDFKPEITYVVNKTEGKDEFLEALNESFPDHDIMYAYRIDGEFSSVTTRSIPPQEEPYPVLSEAVKNQSVFNIRDVSGTISGFWFPEWIQGVNYAGFHPHFITDERDAGGHVLDFTTEDVTVSIQPIYRFTMTLADSR